MAQHPDRERCGYLIQHSDSLSTDRPGAYRVSKDGQSNIIGAEFFEDLDADSDEAFAEFMGAALRGDFPHPFMVEGG